MKKPQQTELLKYYYQRYNLFSKFDEGIRLDDESWFSVTPENIARHIAERFLKSLGDKHLLIVDGFCGVGGNLIQFALSSPHVRVIGCDNCLDRLKMAKHNAEIYGVSHQCEFLHGDFMSIMPSMQVGRIDGLFLSPPWGGVDYKEIKKYSLNNMTPNGFELVRMCRKYMTNNIAFLMPRNIDIDEVRKHLLDKENREFEMEQNMVGSKIKTVTIYFGDLVDDDSEEDDSDKY